MAASLLAPARRAPRAAPLRTVLPAGVLAHGAARPAKRVAGEDAPLDPAAGLQPCAGNPAVVGSLARQPAPPAGSPAGLTWGATPCAVLMAFFENLWQDDPLGAIRLILEAVRPFPLIGLLPGVAADLLAAGQDLMAIPMDHPIVAGFTAGAILARSASNLVGNGLGQLLAVVQLAETAAASTTLSSAATTIGLPLSAVSGAITSFLGLSSEAMNGLKLSLTTVTGTLDVFVAIGTSMAAAFLPAKGHAGKAEAEKWLDLSAAYVANVIGDSLGLLNELIGQLTMGLSQSGLISGVITSLGSFGKILMKALGLGGEWLAGFWNVVGGGTVEGAEPPELPRVLPPDEGLPPVAPPDAGPLPGNPLVTPPAFNRGSAAPPSKGAAPLARSVDGSGGAGEARSDDPAWFAARLVELESMLDGVRRGDGIVDTVHAQVAELVEAAQKMASDASDGRDYAGELKQSVSTALGQVQGRLATVTGFESQGTSALMQLTKAIEAIDATILPIEALELPEIEIPTNVELGQNVVADTVEGVVGMGAEVAADILRTAFDNIRTALQAAKQAVIGPLRDLQAKLLELERLLKTALEAAQKVSAALRSFMTQLTQALMRCDSLPELLQTLIDQALQVTGAAEQVSMDDLQAQWKEFGPKLEQARAAAADRAG